MSFNENIYDKTDFYFREQDIVKKLKISIGQLDSIIEQIDLNNKLKWEELIHYIYTNRNYQERHFSRDGLLIIAEFLRQNPIFFLDKIIDKTSINYLRQKRIYDDLRQKRIYDEDIYHYYTGIAIKKILYLISEFDDKKTDQEIRQITYHHYPRFVPIGSQFWLNFVTCVKLLKTNNQYLRNALSQIKYSSNPLIPDEDIREIEGKIHYSLSGLTKISLELSSKLTSEERKLYCQRVPIVVPPFTKALAQLPPSASETEIKKAMRDAEKRDKKRCQVTGESPDKYNRFNLCQHHLFDKKTYYILAADQDNIISIKEEIHQHFHEWNGGTKKPCTIDDFISYIDGFYSDKHELIAKLMKMRTILNVKLQEYQKLLPPVD